MGNGIGENKITREVLGAYVKSLVKEGKVKAPDLTGLGETISGKKPLTQTKNIEDISKDEGR